jgi:hypothetical protein
LIAQWKALRGQTGLSVRELACAGAPRTMLVAEVAAAGKPVVALSAGVHGDEPAGPWALLSIVRDGLLDPRFAYRIWPCTNPSGYAAGTRTNAEGDDINRSFSRGGTTPESRAIITANRDRSFALSLDLHEDFESDGFYLYENVLGAEPRFCTRIVRAIDEAGFRVQDDLETFDDAHPPGASGSGRTIRTGAIVAHCPQAFAHFESGLPYSIHLLRARAAEHALTFETPRRRRWEDRIAMHRLAVVSALDALSADGRPASKTFSGAGGIY